jgi:hypothetical protein
MREVADLGSLDPLFAVTWHEATREIRWRLLNSFGLLESVFVTG